MSLTAELSLHPLAFSLASKRCAVSLIFKKSDLPRLYLPAAFGDMEDNSVSFVFLLSLGLTPHPCSCQRDIPRNLSTLSSQPPDVGEGLSHGQPGWGHCTISVYTSECAQPLPLIGQ